MLLLLTLASVLLLAAAAACRLRRAEEDVAGYYDLGRKEAAIKAAYRSKGAFASIASRCFARASHASAIFTNSLRM